jgi:sucrose-6-phosphate hydrolase SacC (GH32 family)
MNWPGGALSGPEALTDDRGRVIFFGWIREGRSAALEQYGWDSLICLPRLLSIREDGQLAIAPAPELERLRTRERCIGPLTLAADTVLPLDGIAGDGMELEVAMRAENTGSCGVHLRCSPGGEEHTVVEYLPGAKRLRVDFSRSRSGGDATIEGVSAQEAPLALEDGETLCLRVYVDRSVLEVFANGRQCLTQRIYPARSDSLGVRLFSRGAVTHVRGVKAWDLAL